MCTQVRHLQQLCALLCALACACGQKIAQQKCEEYARYVYRQEAAPVLLPGVELTQQSECGIVEVPLIVGGEKAASKEFPHMAVLGYGDAPDAASWMCGASLVSERHVLTAAHCLKSKDKGPAKWVRTGDTNLEGGNVDANPQVFSVGETHPHPDYKPPARYNDIAIVTLDKEATMDAYTRPACLSTGGELGVRAAIATGFGKMSYDKDETSKDLLKVTLNMIPKDTCSEAFKNDVQGRSLSEGIVDTQLCAGELAGGKDTCQGDSGGPLQTVLATPYCMYSLIAVTNFGKFCGFANSPAVYTAVHAFVPWIESLVWA